MSHKWPKIIQDPIHNLISFEDNDCDKLLLKLIDTIEFQRLRRIKQLGVSELVFPTATHNRFSHSLGVMNIARKIIERIERIQGKRIEDSHRIIILCSALLHDIGHGPFSHAFEKITKENHEKRTYDIISDEQTETNQILRDFDPELPDKILSFFLIQEEEKKESDDIPSFYSHIVSSQLDADRFDYLLRDSYMTGTCYGNFDLEWILQRIHIDEDKQRFYLSKKAFCAAETYIFSRYHMYRSVYFHKATRSAEVMLKSVFSRFKELLESKSGEEISPNSPPAVIQSFSNDKMTIEQYISLDDVTIVEFLKSSTKSSDNILRELSNSLLNRKLYKCVDTSNVEQHKSNEFFQKATELIKSKGMETTYFFVVDTPGDTPYKLYDPDSDRPATQIYIEDSEGKTKEISSISKPVHELTKYTFYRYYFPDVLREDILKIKQEIVGGRS